MPSPEVTRRIGRYRLCAEIASGGSATVYLGQLVGPVGFARQVAIKRLHASLANEPELVSMLIDEARVSVRIRHPNVVPMLDVVADEGEIFLVMDYVHGDSMSRLMRVARREARAIPAPIVAAIVHGVLHGLHAAHEATDAHGNLLGVVHRDVSPENVLVGVDGMARITDFGVAKAAGRLQTTQLGQLKGKLAYMAPEQIRGAAERASDLFAVGVVLWEGLTLERLFAADHEDAVIERVMSSPIVAPSTRSPSIPAALDAVVLRALARDPRERYSTAREMAKELERALAPAKPSDVGDWVMSTARETLTTRAQRITEMEAGADVTERREKPTLPATRAPRRRLWGGLLAATGGAALVIAVLLVRRTQGHTPPVDVRSRVTVTQPVVVDLSPPPPESTGAPVSAPPVTPSASRPTSLHPHAAPRANDRCIPPFVFDAAGHKVYKAQCF